MNVIRWRKARQSESQGDACIEVARLPETVAVHDSKDPYGPKLTLTPNTFRTLLHNLKQ